MYKRLSTPIFQHPKPLRSCASTRSLRDLADSSTSGSLSPLLFADQSRAPSLPEEFVYNGQTWRLEKRHADGRVTGAFSDHVKITLQAHLLEWGPSPVLEASYPLNFDMWQLRLGDL